jgi:phosphatidyl-myo-inositol dimannoside synthase
VKVALITSEIDGKSGWSRVSLGLARTLKEQGHTVSAVVHAKNEKDIEQHTLPFPPRYLTHPIAILWTAWRLRRTLRRLQPDIVHFIAEPYALTLPFLPKRYSTVLTIHGTYAVSILASGTFATRCARKMYERIGSIISVSAYTKNRLQEEDPTLFESIAEKITVIPNAVETPAKPSGKWRKETDEQYVLGVGAVKERKGYLEALDALASFGKKHPDINWRYDIYGSLKQDPLYVEALQDRAEELDIRDRVYLHGGVDDEELEEAYVRADLFLLLSKTTKYDIEGFGIVFLEANVRGVPVIGPESGGCPEAIDEGKSGFVCDGGNPKDVAQRIEDILIDRAISEEDCLRWALGHSLTETTSKVVEVYEKTMEV